MRKLHLEFGNKWVQYREHLPGDRCCDTRTDCGTPVQQIGESTNGKSAEIVINHQVKENVKQQ